MTDVQKSAKVLVSSIVGALVVYFVGDAITYETGANETVGFEEGTATAEVIGIAPLVLVALGLYGAFSYM
jgi:hypothetical protein